MRAIKYIVIHCTATHPDTKVPAIIRFWKEKLGWKNPGYHYVIEASGRLHNLQPEEYPTNGVRGHNRNSLHISYIGGIDEHGKAKDTRTLAQQSTMIHLLQDLKRKYPHAEILGHRDLSPDKNNDGIIDPHEWVKECPSFDVKKWLSAYKI